MCAKYYIESLHWILQITIELLITLKGNRPMNDNMIFFNVAWMHSYQGLQGDSARGGGKHIEEYGWGGEIFNFKPYRGNVYGYVQPKSTIKIEKLGALSTDNAISGITVVWTANHPAHGGTYIVGWYKDATVYRWEMNGLKGMNRAIAGGEVGYYCKARFEDVTLLSPDLRVLQVKRQKKNWMGQSNVWYADQNPKFRKRVLDYIFNGVIPPNPGPKPTTPIKTPWNADFEKD